MFAGDRWNVPGPTKYAHGAIVHCAVVITAHCGTSSAAAIGNVPMALNSKEMRVAHLQRAAKRRHHRCKLHGKPNVLCLHCGRTTCPWCLPACRWCGQTILLPEIAPRSNFTANGTITQKPAVDMNNLPPHIAELYTTFLKPRGALRIELHPDSGGWLAIFPYQLPPYVSAGSLLDALTLDAPAGWAPTSFGAGRRFAPDDWFVSFHYEVAP
jgi:hypothetical protein